MNYDQADLDDDGLGDFCDDDGDGVDDGVDNCDYSANADQADLEQDGLGRACDPDDDNDSVADVADFCPATIIPESVPKDSHKSNHWALGTDDLEFDTVSKGKGKAPKRSFTTTDTAGCSCEQIIEAQGLGLGHTKHGCSNSVMDDWKSQLNP